MASSRRSSLAASIAASLDTPEPLLPVLAELFQDLDALGSDPAAVVAVLRRRGIDGPAARILDLGCGKGAVAIAVARELGAHVEGVDGFAAFVEAARERARREGLSDHCRFETADVRSFGRGDRPWDAVLFLGMAPVLGTLAETVAKLRGYVRTGGAIVLDDAGEPHPIAERRKALEASGDRIAEEIVEPPAAIRAREAHLRAKLAAAADRIAARAPHLGPVLRAAIERQQEEGRRLAEEVSCALWCIERR